MDFALLLGLIPRLVCERGCQILVIWVYLSGMKYAHRSLRFESLSKAESSVAGLVLAIPHSNGGEDRI